MTKPRESSANIAQNLKWFRKQPMIPYSWYQILQSFVYSLQSFREFGILGTKSSRWIFDRTRSIFSGARWIHFFLLHLYVTWYLLFRKKKIYYKVQREKLYNLQNKTYFNCIFLVKEIKTLRDQFLIVQKTHAKRNSVFLISHIKKIFINCRTFQVASCCIFCFVIQRIQWLIIQMQSVLICRIR